MIRFFDTHAHYDDARYAPDRDALLESLPQQQIGLVLNPGCDRQTSQDAVALAKRYPHVYAAVGVHPHEAAQFPDGDVAMLRSLLAEPKVQAIGEIGLDYHYDHSPRDIQQACFAAQLALAQELDMPVIIHDRDAHADTLAILRQFQVKAVYHCYSGSLEQAKIIVSLGHSISFTGAVTFKNARHALETAAWLPADRIMIETDAPYLTPEPHRGKRNDSTHLPLVAQKLAAVRGMTVADFAALTFENGRQFFRIPATHTF